MWSEVTIYDNYDWATINISRSRSSVPGKGVVEGSTKSGRSRTVAVDSDIAGLIACLLYTSLPSQVSSETVCVHSLTLLYYSLRGRQNDA